jgi:hypothetical protein
LSFADRTTGADKFIKKLERYYWERDAIKGLSIIHFRYGYENYVSEEVRESLRYIYTITSKHIRYAPDFIILRKDISKVFLLEYKVVRTPRYSLMEKQWDVGQVEADAFENYINLSKAEIDVTILIYCPYHSRPVLCYKVDDKNNIVIREKTKVISTLGSGTPYINIDLTRIPTFDEFMSEYFAVDKEITNRLLNTDFYKELLTDEDLQVTHHPSSPYKEKITGFNWEDRYKKV